MLFYCTGDGDWWARHARGLPARERDVPQSTLQADAATEMRSLTWERDQLDPADAGTETRRLELGRLIPDATTRLATQISGSPSTQIGAASAR